PGRGGRRGQAPLPLLEQPRLQAHRLPCRLAAARAPSARVAGVVPVQPHRALCRSVDGRLPSGGAHRRAELARGLPPARHRATRVLRAQPRPLRRLPRSPARLGMAPVRRLRPRGPPRADGLDRAPLVGRGPHGGVRGRPAPVPAPPPAPGLSPPQPPLRYWRKPATTSRIPAGSTRGAWGQSFRRAPQYSRGVRGYLGASWTWRWGTASPNTKLYTCSAPVTSLRARASLLTKRPMAAASSSVRSPRPSAWRLGSTMR